MSDKCLPCIKCGVLSAFPQPESSVFICLQCQSVLPTNEAQRIAELESRLKELDSFPTPPTPHKWTAEELHEIYAGTSVLPNNKEINARFKRLADAINAKQ